MNKVLDVYLVRHGQSVPNSEKRHSGWTMLPLTEKGFDDARRAGKALEGIEFDRVYSSDLTRAVQTAQTALNGRDPVQMQLIRERSVGGLMERYFDECAEAHGEEYWQARKSLDFTPFGGENADMVRVRAAEFLKFLEGEEGGTVAAFSHGGFIMHCIECVLGVQFSVQNFVINNGAVVHVRYDGTHWKLIVE